MKYYEHGSRDEAKVALTFDDGPNPPRTDDVLAILARYGVRGSFFVIGRWADRYPRALERIVAAGHCVGNHSYEHQMRVSDYDKAEAAIGNVIGSRTHFARPHSFDFASLSNSLLSRVSTTKVVDADVNPRDYALSDPDAIVRGVLENPALANGSIIDLHDGSEIEDIAQRHSRPLPMIEALPAIIDGLLARGLRPVGLDELTLTDPKEWLDGEEHLMNTNPTGQGLVRRVHA